MLSAGRCICPRGKADGISTRVGDKRLGSAAGRQQQGWHELMVLQVAEIEHKEKINSLMHELTLAQAAGSKEVPGSEQEAKELCVSQHYELMQEIWKGHEHSVHDIRRAAEAQEALLRKVCRLLPPLVLRALSGIIGDETCQGRAM